MFPLMFCSLLVNFILTLVVINLAIDRQAAKSKVAAERDRLRSALLEGGDHAIGLALSGLEWPEFPVYNTTRSVLVIDPTYAERQEAE